MDIRRIDEMVGGWFVGNFNPSIYKTDAFEVGYKYHHKDEPWDAHYHAQQTEINYLISGKMDMNGIELNAGDIFTIYPNEVAAPKFLEDCQVIVVKVPSVIGDKFKVST